METAERTAFLKTTEPFGGAPEDLLRQIAGDMEEMEVEVGTVLFHEEEPGDAVYLVVEGILGLEKYGIPLVARHPGEWVGEFALIDEGPRSASAVAETEVRLLRWEREDFHRILSRSPEIGLGVLRILTGKLRQNITLQVQVHLEQERQRTEAFAEALKGISEGFVGESDALRRVEERLAEVASTDLTVLILGETGTGKGLAARTLHELSAREKGSFIPVNCGAIPEHLVESELFGHERGAFTGAVRRKLGKVELAKGGTLFLDEIGDMSLAAQVKLLHLLEEGTFERVGGTETLSANVRVIAATNHDLEHMVSEGMFREDLYFRLQVFPVRMPPLRERREDIPHLATYFMKRMAAHLHKEVTQLSPEALTALRRYDWPGNVRELQHAVQRGVVVCQGQVIQAEDLGLAAGRVDAQGKAMGEQISPEEYERRYILGVLEETGWVIKGEHGAAARLGLPPPTLRYRMKKLGIRRRRTLSA